MNGYIWHGTRTLYIYSHILHIYLFACVKRIMAPPILEASTNITATLSFLSPFLISFYYFIYIVYKIEVQKHLETGCRRTDRSFVRWAAHRRREAEATCVCATDTHTHTDVQPNRAFTSTRIALISSTQPRTRSHIHTKHRHTSRTERTKTNKHTEPYIIVIKLIRKQFGSVSAVISFSSPSSFLFAAAAAVTTTTSTAESLLAQIYTCIVYIVAFSLRWCYLLLSWYLF